MVVEKSIIGEKTKILFPGLVNIYGCKIGSNCLIAPFVEIQKNVVIGNNCKIESHSFICSRAFIGNNVFIGHGVMFTNDRYPKAIGHNDGLEDTIIEDNVSIGSGSIILPGVTIGESAMIGAGAIVIGNVPSNTIVKGIWKYE